MSKNYSIYKKLCLIAVFLAPMQVCAGFKDDLFDAFSGKESKRLSNRGDMIRTGGWFALLVVCAITPRLLKWYFRDNIETLYKNCYRSCDHINLDRTVEYGRMIAKQLAPKTSFDSGNVSDYIRAHMGDHSEASIKKISEEIGGKKYMVYLAVAYPTYKLRKRVDSSGAPAELKDKIDSVLVRANSLYEADKIIATWGECYGWYCGAHLKLSELEEKFKVERLAVQRGDSKAILKHVADTSHLSYVAQVRKALTQIPSVKSGYPDLNTRIAQLRNTLEKAISSVEDSLEYKQERVSKKK